MSSPNPGIGLQRGEKAYHTSAIWGWPWLADYLKFTSVSVLLNKLGLYILMVPAIDVSNFYPNTYYTTFSHATTTMLEPLIRKQYGQLVGASTSPVIIGIAPELPRDFRIRGLQRNLPPRLLTIVVSPHNPASLSQKPPSPQFFLSIET